MVSSLFSNCVLDFVGALIFKVMAKKAELTEEEIAEKLAVKKYNAAARKIKNRAKANCKKQGLRALELQLEYIKSNDTPLPSELISRESTVKLISEGIEEYKFPPVKKVKKQKA